jgi:hypothetical protein
VRTTHKSWCVGRDGAGVCNCGALPADAPVRLDARVTRIECIIERLAINTGTTVPEIERLIDRIAKGEA